MAIGMERLSSKPTAPKTGYDILYTKAGKLYMEDSNGLETEISGGTGPGGVQNNFGAAVAPTVNDDSGDGYAIGSMWLDTTNNRLYMAKSVSVGAASWMWISVKNNLAATTYPGVTDDIAAGYSIGSTWINLTVNATFVARSVTAGAAVWRSVGISYGVANAAPTVNEDVGEGYAVGSTWYDYSANTYYICDSAAEGAAVWLKICVPCNLTATAAPGVGDDNLDGYAIGSIWLDTTNNNFYIAKSVGTGTASWMQLATKNNYGAAVAPGVTDDIAAGYGVGSLWYDTTANYVYRAKSVSAGAAVWVREAMRNSIAGAAPTVNSDTAHGYAIGSTWWDSTNHIRYFCTDATTGAAVWKTTPVADYAWTSASTISGSQLISTVATGTAPLTVASTTAVSNLNADLLDGNHASAFLTSLSGAVLANGTVPLTAAWDAGSYQIRAETFQSDVATGTAPFTVASTTKVTNLQADYLDGYGATATHGVSVIPATDQYLGQINSNFVGNAGGSRAQNRIGNYGAEIDTAGWATYADAAGTAPVNGTGGSPTVTWTRTTTGPLRGTGAFLFTKDAANRQGEGASYDFTIENSEQTSVFNISFDYAIVSGTYATGDLTVYIYDVTNGVVIQPSSYQIAAGTATYPYVFQGYFQAQLGSTSYRLIIHTASTSSSAYTVQIDGVRVAVEPQTRGPIVTDYKYYTPTGAWTSNTTYYGYWRRIGDEMQVRMYVILTGTPTTAEFSFNLPPGYTIDTAKLLDANGANNAFGQAMILDSGTDRYAAIVSYLSTTAVRVQVMPHGSTYTGQNTAVTQAIPMTWTTNDMMVGWFSVPISGWSSNVVLSSDADVRTVEASYYISGSTANAKLANATPEILDFDTKINDTHNAVTTGASWKFTAPISGYYIVTSALRLSAATPTAASSAVVNYIYVDGVLVTSAPVTRANQTASSVNYSSNVCGIQYLAAGSYIQIYGYQSISASDTTIDTSGTYYNYVHIIRMGGPQTITPVETVHAHYQNSAGTTLSNAKETSIPWATKVVDTHNGMTTATGVYTIPIAGTYLVNALVTPLGLASYAVDSTLVSRNGAGNELGRGIRITAPAGSYALPNMLCYTERFNAGDTVVIKCYESNSHSDNTTLEATATSNQFTIVRIGL